MMYLDKLQVGSKLSPRVGGTVGFGVLLSFPTEEKSFYTVLTDFGNQIYLTKESLFEYYTNDGVIYRFKDWLEVDSFEDWFIKNKDNLKGRVELSKDPKEEHWEHFLDLEIKTKKNRLQKCKEWVDTVLKKQQKYNDICLINEVATTPLIHDYETLKNFCNMSGEKVKFEEYEITNCLLIIRNTLTKV